MPQITVMPAIRSKVGDSWRIKTLDDDNIISISDRQHGHQRQTSNPYYINFKRRTRNVVNMKPLQHYTDLPPLSGILAFHNGNEDFWVIS